MGLPSDSRSEPCFLAAATPAPAADQNFDRQKPGAVPRHWLVAMTHEGGPPKWAIVTDPSAPSRPNVLAQTSTDATSGRYPLAIYQKAVLTNGSVSVRFKAVSGGGDQAAGIVWRYQDADNYYVVRANALEDNVVLYKVQDGKRISLAPKGAPAETYGVKQKVPRQTWSTLKVIFEGTRFAIFFDGSQIMEVDEASFAAAGKTGLWTKADSVTYFDDFRVQKVK